MREISHFQSNIAILCLFYLKVFICRRKNEQRPSLRVFLFWKRTV